METKAKKPPEMVRIERDKTAAKLRATRLQLRPPREKRRGFRFDPPQFGGA